MVAGQLADLRHRALRHHAEGIFLAEKVFGVTLTNSAGKLIPVRWVAEQHSVLLFDRLAIMRYWSEEGTFDLYAATTGYAMARRVHECIGRALASQIINAAHLDAAKMQTTR